MALLNGSNSEATDGLTAIIVMDGDNRCCMNYLNNQPDESLIYDGEGEVAAHSLSPTSYSKSTSPKLLTLPHRGHFQSDSRHQPVESDVSHGFPSSIHELRVRSHQQLIDQQLSYKFSEHNQDLMPKQASYVTRVPNSYQWSNHVHQNSVWCPPQPENNFQNPSPIFSNSPPNSNPVHNTSSSTLHLPTSQNSDHVPYLQRPTFMMRPVIDRHQHQMVSKGDLVNLAHKAIEPLGNDVYLGTPDILTNLQQSHGFQGFVGRLE